MVQIDSHERPRFTLTDQNSYAFVEAFGRLRNRWRERREKLMHSFPAERVLTPDNQRLLTTVEQESRAYYQQKLSLHKIDINPISDVKIVYMDEFSEDIKANCMVDDFVGAFDGSSDIAVVQVRSNEPEEMLNVAKSVHHELGHAIGTSEVIFGKGKNTSKGVLRNGFIRIVDGQPKGQAIEEGLVTLDEIDFYQNYLTNVFPRSYTREQIATIDQIHNSLKAYFDVSREDMNAFVSLTDTADQGAIGIKQIQVYSFIKYLARFFDPKSQDPTVGPNHMGRYLLDTARFTYDNRVIDLMNETLLPKATSFILDIPAWPDAEKSMDMSSASDILKRRNVDSFQMKKFAHLFS